MNSAQPEIDLEEIFQPAIAAWFHESLGTPTWIQAAAWPRIASGEHALISAPTGSGKTLTAFLWAINQLVAEQWPAGETSVLYVSPLKALNNDIQRNLVEPLEAITERLHSAGAKPPGIRVLTRSGDTPQSERRNMVIRPPEILITTPESLNLILSSPRARNILATVRTVILDEIHAVVDGKRGTHLVTAVDRIVRLAGEFQRIAISATVRPMDLVAQFVGGWQRTGDGFRRRDVAVVQAPHSKKLKLSVEFPAPLSADDSGGQAGGSETEPGSEIWPALISRLHEVINGNRSTLIFVTTRRHAEKITELLNEGLDRPIAYAHHGSLSREIRSYVEESLKAGRLRAIVATNSLELGIDIGALDQVVMVKTPMSVASTLQRMGRAGHQVGATSRGVLYPLYGRDAVDAAVVARAALEQNIEPVKPVVAPLDVLAQQLVSMTTVESWDMNDLYAEIRRSWPYHQLERRLFDLVVEMLAGRYASTRIRDLKPRVIVDRVANSIRAREGAATVLYQSGGTIPDRGYFGLRLAGDGARIGELDEEFVWERKVGDTFYLGSQLWTISRIGDRDVEVSPGVPGSHIIPFWKAEARGRGSHLADLTMEFLKQCESAIREGRLDGFLEERSELQTSVISTIRAALLEQRAATGTALPHRHHVVVEECLNPGGGRRGNASDAREIVLHCPWGLSVNQPLAIVLAGSFEEIHGVELEISADDSCIAILLPDEVPADDILGAADCRRLLRSGAIERLLHRRLERSGLFGALFRENAGRALLLPKGGFNRRMPLWLNRLRSRKLLGAVESFEDFPIVLETWRTCLQDRFDLQGMRRLLSEISTGAVRISRCSTTSPSPFAADVVWRQTNLYMYLDDSRPGASGSMLSEDLLRDAARHASLRPDIPGELVEQLERRLQRLEEAYSPDSGEEVVDWLRERIVIPESECMKLHLAMARDAGGIDQAPEPTTNRLCWITPEPGGAFLLAAVDQLPLVAALVPDLTPERLRDASAGDWWEPPEKTTAPSEHLRRLAVQFLQTTGIVEPLAAARQWLRYYGPMTVTRLAGVFGTDTAMVDNLVHELAQDGSVVAGFLTVASAEPQVCDTENMEHLLALLRRSHRRVFEQVDGPALVSLWARLTGIAPVASGKSRGDHSHAPDNPDHLVDSLEALFGYPAPATLWECDIFPARLRSYYPVWLDGLFKESNLLWLGTGKERLAFALAEDLDLFREEGDGEPGTPGDPSGHELLGALRHSESGDFWDIRTELDATSEDVTGRLWSAAWSGLISNDSFETVRRGILSRFKPDSSSSARRVENTWPGRRGRPVSRRSWAASRPLSGRWFALETSGDREPDPIEELEREKERARIMLGRYGVVFRELVERESPAFRWRGIFRALRMMELSGEVVTGSFVRGIRGIQFATPHALDHLSSEKRSSPITWMNAMDPASPCGTPLAAWYPELPNRIAGNHLVFRGDELALVSRRNGRDLTILVEPDDSDLPQTLAPLENMVARRWNPQYRVVTESINGTDAADSPYASALINSGYRRDRRRLVLSASYR